MSEAYYLDYLGNKTPICKANSLGKAIELSLDWLKSKNKKIPYFRLWTKYDNITASYVTTLDFGSHADFVEIYSDKEEPYDI